MISPRRICAGMLWNQSHVMSGTTSIKTPTDGAPNLGERGELCNRVKPFIITMPTNSLPARTFHLSQLRLTARALSQMSTLGADSSKRSGNLVPRISQLTKGENSWLAVQFVRPAEARFLRTGVGCSKLRTHTALGSYRRACPRSIGPT